jgi:hypothetical protein
MKQYFGTIAIADIGPFERSEQVITSGWYSLSSLSTIPYVRLTGSHGAQKIFSWGELVYIPDGETAFVENMSCHRGDIFLNGGRDYSNIPSRITVPVPLVTIASPFEDTFFTYPQYPIDTRRAKRAYASLDVITSNTPTTIITTGKVINHNHNTYNKLQDIITLFPDFFAGVGYFSTWDISPPIINYGQFPLGYQANFAPDGNPHNLLDMSSFLLVYPGGGIITINDCAYYTLEY